MVKHHWIGTICAGLLALWLPAPAAGQPASLLRDINSTTIDDDLPLYTASFDLQAAGNRLFFLADAGGAGDELWTSDGTSAGTQLVRDLCPGFCNVEPGLYGAVGSVMLWTAGGQIWRSDGTRPGTFALTNDTGPHSPGTVFKGAFYFAEVPGGRLRPGLRPLEDRRHGRGHQALPSLPPRLRVVLRGRRQALFPEGRRRRLGPLGHRRHGAGHGPAAPFRGAGIEPAPPRRGRGRRPDLLPGRGRRHRRAGLDERRHRRRNPAADELSGLRSVRPLRRAQGRGEPGLFPGGRLDTRDRDLALGRHRRGHRAGDRSPGRLAVLPQPARRPGGGGRRRDLPGQRSPLPLVAALDEQRGSRIDRPVPPLLRLRARPLHRPGRVRRQGVLPALPAGRQDPARGHRRHGGRQPRPAALRLLRRPAAPALEERHPVAGRHGAREHADLVQRRDPRRDGPAHQPPSRRGKRHPRRRGGDRRQALLPRHRRRPRALGARRRRHPAGLHLPARGADLRAPAPDRLRRSSPLHRLGRLLSYRPVVERGHAGDHQQAGPAGGGRLEPRHFRRRPGGRPPLLPDPAALRPHVRPVADRRHPPGDLADRPSERLQPGPPRRLSGEALLLRRREDLADRRHRAGHGQDRRLPFGPGPGRGRGAGAERDLPEDGDQSIPHRILDHRRHHRRDAAAHPFQRAGRGRVAAAIHGSRRERLLLLARRPLQDGRHAAGDDPRAGLGLLRPRGPARRVPGSALLLHGGFQLGGPPPALAHGRHRRGDRPDRPVSRPGHVQLPRAAGPLRRQALLQRRRRRPRRRALGHRRHAGRHGPGARHL